MITKKKFKELTKQWKEETINMSSFRCISKNPSYREIVNMGLEVVPWIIEELKRKSYWWFMALSEITGETPIPHESLGKLDACAAAWIKWYEDHKVKDYKNYGPSKICTAMKSWFDFTRFCKENRHGTSAQEL